MRPESVGIGRVLTERSEVPGAVVFSCKEVVGDKVPALVVVALKLSFCADCVLFTCLALVVLALSVLACVDCCTGVACVDCCTVVRCVVLSVALAGVVALPNLVVMDAVVADAVVVVSFAVSVVAVSVAALKVIVFKASFSAFGVDAETTALTVVFEAPF